MQTRKVASAMEAERVMSALELELWQDEEETRELVRPARRMADMFSTVTYPAPAAPAPSVEIASALQGTYALHGKRILDVVLSLLLLVVAIPLVLGLALVVLITSGRPIFHRARRVGLHGEEFTMWKLRSMVPDADRMLEEWRFSRPNLAEAYFTDYKLKDDRRVTPLGRFLRKSSLDELPQIFNVLRGDMSLVGPRPVVREELRHYGANTRDFLAVRPGITGRWQTDGRNDIRYPERSWFELTYCRTYSLSMDLKILARTLISPLRFDG